MKAVLRFIKTTLLGGLLVLLPTLIVAAALQKAFGIAVGIVRPVEKALPDATVMGATMPHVTAVLLILVVCFVAGLLAQTGLGQRVARALEQRILDRIPGYALVRSMLSGTLPTERPVEVALVEMESMQCFAFVMERHANGYVTLFVPSAPTPTSGSVFFVEASRVRVIDATIKDTLNCISRLGLDPAPSLRSSLGAAAKGP